MPNVFLSYSRPDAVAAEAIAEAIRQSGSSVFRDTALVAGDHYGEVIKKAIRRADIVVVLLSKNVNRSRWVQSELISALEQKKTIIPVLLDQNAKDNYVWSLIADRQAIEGTEPLEAIAQRVSDAVLLTETRGAQASPAALTQLSSWRWLIFGALLIVLAGALAKNVWHQQQIRVSDERAALATAQENVGDELALTAPNKALESYRAALAIRESLVTADPSDVRRQREIATTYGRVGKIEAQLGASDRARNAYLSGRAIIERLRNASPDDAALQRELEWFDQQIALLRS
jgi:TIR domain-containing protein